MLNRSLFGCAMLAASLLVAAGADASQLLLPHLGGRDGGLSGNVVASPGDGAGILLFNPAGVADLDGTQTSFGFESGNMTGRYTNAATGYDAKSSENPVAPTLWLSSDELAPWHLGVGLYGAVGSSFNFAADPDSGMPSRLLGENAVLHLGLLAAREVAPGLRVGIQVAPSFGKLKGRTPSPLGNVFFDVDGFGITGSAGLLYDIGAATTVGLSYRAPGIVFMSGNGTVDDEPEHVEIDLRLPQAVTAGIAHKLTPRLLLTAQAAWTNYPDFESGRYKFRNNPALDQDFIAKARAVVRWGGGIEYAVREWAWLRAGFSYEPWMIDESALRPTLYDGSDFMLMLGAGFRFDRWTIDAQTGFGRMDDRVVSASDQAFFPGRYKLESGVEIGVTVTYRLSGGTES